MRMWPECAGCWRGADRYLDWHSTFFISVLPFFIDHCISHLQLPSAPQANFARMFDGLSDLLRTFISNLRTDSPQINPLNNLPPRPPQLNKQGQEVSIGLNSFKVTKYPSKPVYQYDVLIVGENNPDKPIVIKKVWESNAAKSKLGPGWVFDGNKLAW